MSLNNSSDILYMEFTETWLTEGKYFTKEAFVSEGEEVKHWEIATESVNRNVGRRRSA